MKGGDRFDEKFTFETTRVTTYNLKDFDDFCSGGLYNYKN